MSDIKPKHNYLQQSITNKARSDKFVCVLTFPKALQEINAKYSANVNPNKIITDRLQFSVYGITVPPISVPAVPVSQYQQTFNVSSFVRPAYGPVSIKFAIDSEYLNYYVIWKWLNIMNDNLVAIPERKNNGQFLANYASDFQIFGLNEYNQSVIQFYYKSCFPVSLGGLTYSYQNPAELNSEFSFEFNQLDVILQ